MDTFKSQALSRYNKYFRLFLAGDEKGLEFFYRLLYPSLYFSSLRYIKDDVNADCIVSESFLRLWLARKSITCSSQIETFLRKITAEGCKAYFKASKSRFHRNLLRLDELENYQDYMAGHDPKIKEDDESIYQYVPDDENKEQWEKVHAVIPNLSSEQQLFLRLCIRYAFDYGRIAWHIGGISDYQVARKVEKTLACLKSIITDTSKLEAVGKRSKYRLEGQISDEQSTILHMRYELQYSFAEIASALKLDQGYIQQAFVTASLKVKKIKL